ncbi:MAG TPA: TonB-dependent receptor, partial [Terriglobia bacterium]|nr:TonB-dependent receptor [Terriglobia bacterium]
ITTTNFKAEYQKSSSAIITAVTKSGTNEWEAHAFTDFLNENFVSLDTFSRANKNTNPNFKKPELKRYLGGLSVGGPIVRDKVFFFGSYEGNFQDREGTTRFNGNSATWPAAFAAVNGEQHVSPFRSHLGFAKVTLNQSERQTFEFTGDFRRESDKRRFGGQFTGPDEAFSTGEDFQSNVATGRIKHSLFGTGWTNEALASYQKFQWATEPFNPDSPFLVYRGIGNIGGRNASQDLTQGRLSLRNDFTYVAWQAAGSHVLKVGANFDHLNYDMTKRLQDNPQFIFDGGNAFAFPVEASIGAGDPSVEQSNNQFGLYAQDDWSPIERLTINAGIRWDYESGMYNRDYVTPSGVVDSLTAYRSQLFMNIDPDRYFTDGDDREAFYGAIQPRLGFSYGLDRQSRTVVFGGWGIFYDRLTFNSTIDEAYNRQHPTYNFRFGPADIPAQNVVKWDPSYFSAAGLQGLLSRGRVPPGEVFLMPNDLKPPKSNQWSFGARHDFGAWNTALTYTGTRSDNGFTFEWANHKLNDNGTCCVFRDFLVPSYRNVLVGRNDLRTWYDALFLQVDRPYRKTSGWNWGAGLAWTYTITAETEGGDLFSFPVVENQPRRPLDDFERHRIVANMLTDVPYAWGIQFSTLITLGTGRRFNSQDFSGPIPIVERGVTDPEKFGFIIPNAFAFRNVDIRLRKDFARAAGNRVGVTFDVFNVFNFNNYGCFNDVFATNDNGTRKINADYGKPGCIIADPRRAQIGLSYDFEPRRM